MLFLARLHFIAEELLLFSRCLRPRQRPHLHLNFAYHTNKAPYKKAYDRRASVDCGTSGWN